MMKIGRLRTDIKNVSYCSLWALAKDILYSEIENANYVEEYKSKLNEEKKDLFEKMREMHFILLQIEKDILKRKCLVSCACIKISI